MMKYLLMYLKVQLKLLWEDLDLEQASSHVRNPSDRILTPQISWIEGGMCAVMTLPR